MGRKNKFKNKERGHWWDLNNIRCPYDPHFTVDYTGTGYNIEELEMREKFKTK